uniref:E3 ubiquitin-protein ligase PPP1R11 n=1 Tax=Neogobius melanostomus TaxID=47308 RepID=A0A8C6T7D0_9GOBI
MMAEVPGTSSETITETVQTSTPPPPQQEGRSLTIKLRKRKTEKKVEWSSDTVDNEHLGRRSSKCCCIYEKPRQFGESSSESEGEDDDGGCGSAHCIMGHGRRGNEGHAGHTGGSGGNTAPPNASGGAHAH